MITSRTKILFFLVAICGIGIGVLAQFSDGLYSAVLLLCFPFLVAFTALAIGIDLNTTSVAKTETWVREKPSPAGFVLHLPLGHWHRGN